ncbi:hypothetical protein ABH931_005876 [Streptacidiphilus sp. MAP12-33]|uniref:hypothetical protein n=1 Tax=Streptacidiphilus sp. MAP12-33 TaxID=3156266 RepID=UPI0035166627
MTDAFDLAARLPAALRDGALAEQFLTDFADHRCVRPLRPGDGHDESEWAEASA